MTICHTKKLERKPVRRTLLPPLLIQILWTYDRMKLLSMQQSHRSKSHISITQPTILHQIYLNFYFLLRVALPLPYHLVPLYKIIYHPLLLLRLLSRRVNPTWTLWLEKSRNIRDSGTAVSLPITVTTSSTEVSTKSISTISTNNIKPISPFLVVWPKLPDYSKSGKERIELIIFL